ncbi:MAG: hypothetical protein U0V75_00070 [Ferruginibacter sp.]
MRVVISILALLFFSVNSYTQQLDQSITEIANDLAQKVVKKQRVKLALTDFVNSEGKTDALTDYIREELEMKLINNENNLQVIDRKHIKLLLSEHHLQSEGLIDETTAKSAISFIKIDGWVLAEITSLGDQIKIKVTVTDISTSQIYAASASSLITDVAIKNLLDPEIKICSQCGGRGTVQTVSTCATCSGKGSYSCSDCKGTGHRPGMTVGSYITCEACSGKGTFSCKACSGNGKLISNQTCPKCNGKVRLPGKNATNQIPAQICDACVGKGKIKEESSCEKCGGSGEAPFGAVSNWERKPCSSCKGKGQIVTYKSCSKCNGTGKL